MLEENYNNDIAKFNDEWNIKLNDFNANSKKVEEQLTERHKKELQDLVNGIESQFKKDPKFSSTYLQYKDAERKLIKLEDYLRKKLI